MVSKVEVRKVLKKLFKKARVATLDELFEVLETRSRVTVFRRLKEMGYLSSFTHNGRYYTLTELPDFDERGLWFFRNIGFSRAGTLKETTFELVETSFEGRTHEELKNLLRVRVHNTLLTLVREGRIGRERLRRIGRITPPNVGVVERRVCDKWPPKDVMQEAGCGPRA
jgi:hypothetical protein